jgi:RimJ/RimL family protein N-acetyltransferase
MCAIETRERIATERLVLRRPGLQDAARIADLINDYDVARMLTRVPHPYGLGDAEAFLGTDEAREASFLIEHPSFGPIGMIGLHDGPNELVPLPIPELGYWLGRTFWGNGFATEAATAVLGWARARGMRAAASGHYADNPASGRVLEKAGFLYTGEVRPRDSAARGEAVDTRMMVWLA